MQGNQHFACVVPWDSARFDGLDFLGMVVADGLGYFPVRQTGCAQVLNHLRPVVAHSSRRLSFCLPMQLDTQHPVGLVPHDVAGHDDAVCVPNDEMRAFALVMEFLLAL